MNTLLSNFEGRRIKSIFLLTDDSTDVNALWRWRLSWGKHCPCTRGFWNDILTHNGDA